MADETRAVIEASLVLRTQEAEAELRAMAERSKRLLAGLSSGGAMGQGTTGSADYLALRRAESALSRANYAARVARTAQAAERMSMAGATMPAGIDQTIAESKAAQQRIRETTGNPFVVVSKLVERFTGIDALNKAVASTQAALISARAAYKSSATEANLLALKEAEAAAALATGKTTGAGFAVKSLVNFALNSVATSVIIFGAFQLIQGAMTALAEAADRAINPAKYLAEEIKNIAAAVERAGSGKKYAESLGLSGTSPLVTSLDAVRAADQFRTTFTSVIDAIKAGTKDLSILRADNAKTLAESLGVYSDPLLASLAPGKGTRGILDFIRSAGSGNLSDSNADQAVKLLSEQNALRFKTIGLEERYNAVFNRIVAAGGTYAAALKGAVDETINYQLNQIEFSGAISAAKGALDEYRALQLKQGLLAPSSAVEVAQANVTSAQNRLSRLQAAVSAASRTDQVREAQRAVARAGVAGTGSTIFDVAQAVMRAQAEADRARKDAAVQARIAAAQEAVASAQDKLAKAEDQKRTNELLALIKENTSKLDPQSLADLIKERPELRIILEGKDKDGITLAAAINGILGRFGGAGRVVPQ